MFGLMTKKDTPHTLAARALRSARKAAHLTQLDLGRALGVAEVQISRWETGRSLLRSADASRILAAFRVAGGGR